MPKIAKEMTALEVKRLRHRGSKSDEAFAVGGVSGLLLRIKPTGARSWVLRSMVEGKRLEFGLGPFPEVTLSKAKDEAREIREQIRKGRNPAVDRKKARKRLTLADAVELYIDAKRDLFKTEKRLTNYRSAFATHIFPHIGERNVASLTVHDIEDALRPTWSTKAVTAGKLRGWLEAVLGWATVSGHREGPNPARWRDNLDALLPAHAKVAKTQHYPALSLEDIPVWFAELRTRQGSASRALEFMALTCVRSGEIRSAEWSDVDLQNRTWTIPAKKMKMDREHRVPLSQPAINLLQGMRRNHGLLFPNHNGDALSNAAIGACMRRMSADRQHGYLDPRDGRPAVPHGIRSTFKEWAIERTTHPNELSEIVLAHKVGNAVEQAYRRSDMVERRRTMMDNWADFLATRRTPNVSLIQGGKR